MAEQEGRRRTRPDMQGREQDVQHQDHRTDDRGLIQLCIDSLTQRIAELGLTLVIERDFHKLNAILTSNDTFANPTFDPTKSRMGPQDFFVHLLDETGRSVGTSAERVFDTEDLLEMIADGTLFYEGGYRKLLGVDRLPILPLSRRFPGRVSHSGSTWTHPDWRRKGLAMYMAYLSRALSFRNAGCSVNTGFVRQYLIGSSVPRESYGYLHVELVVDGEFPPVGGPEKAYLCWVDRAEFVDTVRALPNHPKNPVPLRPLAEPGLVGLPATG